jgi:predicted metal-binding protein
MLMQRDFNRNAIYLAHAMWLSTLTPPKCKYPISELVSPDRKDATTVKILAKDAQTIR